MVIVTVVKSPHCSRYWLSLTGIFNYERIPKGEKTSHSCRVIGTMLVGNPISLLPTPSIIFPIRWAHSWALEQSLINNTKYESTVKISNKKYRVTWKNLLIDRRNLSVNARTAERITKVDAFTVITKINRWILMQINKYNWSNW